jgi:hypothetical protein
VLHYSDPLGRSRGPRSVLEEIPGDRRRRAAQSAGRIDVVSGCASGSGAASRTGRSAIADDRFIRIACGGRIERGSDIDDSNASAVIAASVVANIRDGAASPGCAQGR